MGISLLVQSLKPLVDEHSEQLTLSLWFHTPRLVLGVVEVGGFDELDGEHVGGAEEVGCEVLVEEEVLISSRYGTLLVHQGMLEVLLDVVEDPFGIGLGLSIRGPVIDVHVHLGGLS